MCTIRHFVMAVIQPYFATQKIRMSVSSQLNKDYYFFCRFSHEYCTAAFWGLGDNFGIWQFIIKIKLPKLNLPKFNFQFYNHIMNNMKIAKIKIKKNKRYTFLPQITKIIPCTVMSEPQEEQLVDFFFSLLFQSAQKILKTL